MFALPDELVRAGVALRPDAPSDRPFLRALFATARLDAPFLAHWPAEQREPFLDQQFQFQDLHYRRYHAGADFLIVERRGAPAGRIVLDRSAPDWCLVDIALLPQTRGQGLGAGLLRAMQAAAAASGAASIELNVEVGNPARRLYERLGFAEVEGESGTHTAMIFRPVS